MILQDRSSINVCVIFGGMSTEYDISLRSAYNVINGLKQAGFDVSMLGITRNGEWLEYASDPKHILDDTWTGYCKDPKDSISINTLRGFISSVSGRLPDIIFPVVHGINCEDGTLQGLLELSKIPYVGCNVTASALGMDKVLSRKLFKASGIPCCRFLPLTREGIAMDHKKLMRRVERRIGYPCFIKPANGGSSVGTYKVETPEQLLPALQKAARFDNTVIVEEWISAREIEVAVLGNDDPKLSVPGEILTASGVEFYDYNTKYIDKNGASLCIPARITVNEKAKILRYAKKAYKLLGCSGLSRVDFFIDRNDGRILLNEINTMPGFTPISLFPLAWEKSGMTMDMLVTRLCELAMEYKESKKRVEVYE